MATRSPLASVPVTATLPALSLRQILLVHLIIFQEAVFGYPVHEFKFVEWFQETGFSIGLFIWDYKWDLSRPDTARLSSDGVYRALIMRSNCDTFCAMMQRFVHRHLEELLGLIDPTEWTSFLAKPQLRLITDMKELSRLIGHSCLLITDGNGGEYTFDGTTDQYGRDWKTHWLMAKEELMRSHMCLGRGFQKWTGVDKAAFRAILEAMKYQHGYWAIASRRMEQIFQELE